MAGNLGVRKQLCEVGDITAAQASKWFRQAPDWQRGLTEEGIHPHPGPCCPGSVGLISVNCVWRGFKEWLETGAVDILCVQELRASDNEIMALRKNALNLGFQMYCQSGLPTRGLWNNWQRRGGVALFPHRTLSQRPAHGGVLSRSLSLPRNGVEILVRSSLRGPCMKSYNQIVSEVRTRQKLTGTP